MTNDAGLPVVWLHRKGVFMAANDNAAQQSSFSGFHGELEKRTYSVQEVARILQISRSKVYQLCDGKEFKVIKLGRLVRISKISFDEWLERNL